jgi:hypothetical protein
LVQDGRKVVTLQLGDTVYNYIEGATTGKKQRLIGFAARGFIKQIEEVRTKGKKVRSHQIGAVIYDEYSYEVNLPKEMAAAYLSRTTSLPYMWRFRPARRPWAA